MGQASDYLHAKAAANKIPLSGTFELSPVCNFACHMCYVRKTQEQINREGKRLRTWQEWLELGKAFRDAGMLYLLLTGGEPFIYPGFRQLYEQLHRMGILISINTNGSCIDEETVAWLKKYAPQRVNVTLYGASPDTYGRVCGNPSGFEKTEKAIRLLVDAGIPTVINCSMIPENQADLEKIVAFGKSLDLNTRVASYMFPPVRREKEAEDSRFTPEEAATIFMRQARCTMSEEHYQKFLRENETHEQAQNSSEEDWGTDSEQMRCRAGRSAFWVSWDGTMTACGIMDFPRQEHPFRDGALECWLRLTNHVRSVGVLKECQGCPHRELCRPCAAMLYAETGDVNKKAPYMCQMAETVMALVRMEAENNEK